MLEIWKIRLMIICIFVRTSLHAVLYWKIMMDLPSPCLNEPIGMPFIHFWNLLFMSQSLMFMLFCSIHAYVAVLMEINVGLLFTLPCWSCPCMCLGFLEKFHQTRFWWWWMFMLLFWKTLSFFLNPEKWMVIGCCCWCYYSIEN